MHTRGILDGEPDGVTRCCRDLEAIEVVTVPTDSVIRQSLRSVIGSVVAGHLLEDVDRCILRVESPRLAEPWVGADGPAVGEAWDSQSAFRAASVTKMVTAATALALCDRDVWSLDAPLGRYLEDPLVDRVHVWQGVSSGRQVTIRQCLDHTSGLPDHFAHPAVWAAVRGATPRHRYRPDDLVELAIDNGPPTFAPGTGRRYTDTGFVLVGLAAEAVTGEPLSRLYRDLVLDPAGACETWFEAGLEPAPSARLAKISPHTLDGADITSLDPTVDWAGGGLATTARDLARLLRAITSGGLLSAAARAEMRSFRPGPVGYYDEYGLGFGRFHIGGHHLVGHHGVWGAFAFADESCGSIITGTVNRAGVDRRPLLEAVVDALAS